MWVEAILSKDDLTKLAVQFTPVKINFEGSGDLQISDPSEITLVPDVGLRVVCKATLHWPVLHIPVPVTAHSVVAIVRPEIAKRATGDALVFKLELEHVDLAWVPSVIDAPLIEMMNQELAKKNVELSWDFFKTLSHVFDLPASLEPLEAFGLEVLWGGIKVTAEAMVLAVSFESRVLRAKHRPS